VQSKKYGLYGLYGLSELILLAEYNQLIERRSLLLERHGHGGGDGLGMSEPEALRQRRHALLETIEIRWIDDRLSSLLEGRRPGAGAV
jgi:hypothetical protein